MSGTPLKNIYKHRTRTKYTIMQLQTFELIIDEDWMDTTGVFAVSVVSDPAIEREAMFFDKDTPIQKFQVENEDERIISGPLLIADKKIYRHNEAFGEHYIVFNTDTIKKIMQKFFMNGFQNNSNLEHNELLKLEGVSMFESFQIDREKGINPPTGYEDLSDGSWFGSFKVYDKEVWNTIKAGDFKGFSVEGTFQYKPTEQEIDFSYDDYPKAAVNNAQRALDIKEETDIDCGTRVGWERANQLVNGENLTRDTIGRMASFARHRGNSDGDPKEDCGALMWLAWGGDEGIDWAQRKLDEIDNEATNKLLSEIGELVRKL